MNKTVCLLFIFLSSFCNGFGQNKSNLTISTTGNSNLKIKLGNNRYSFQDRTATFQGLTPGNYDLTVFQWQKRPDGSNDYVQVYNSTVKLVANRHTEISILRFGKVAWDEGAITGDGWNDSHTNPSPVTGNGNFNNYRQEVDAAQFAQIKKAINSEFGDESMLRMAKVAMKNNLFTTAQVKEIANTFFSDETKLDFAKYAYDYVVDKGNYITIGDVLFSSENRKALLNYISNH